MKAFLFDMDGVIIDSEPLHFEVEMMTMDYLGLTATKEYLEQFVGMTNPEMWKRVKEEHQVPHTVEQIIDYQIAKKLNHLDKADLEPIDGILELIQDLQTNGIAIGLASSSPRSFIERVLTKFQINQHFNSIVSGEEVANGKPAPDVYLEAARVLGVSPEDCYVLEDSRNGVLAAKKAGMRCIGYRNPNSGNQDLSAADVVVDSIRDIRVGKLV